MCFLMFTVRTGYIYFMQMENTWPIKIGISSDPNKRLYQINTSSPYPVKLLYFRPGCEEDEKMVHHVFREFKIRNEWFHPGKRLKDFINSMIDFDLRKGRYNWKLYNKERDLGDWTLASKRWEEPWVNEVNKIIETEVSV